MSNEKDVGAASMEPIVRRRDIEIVYRWPDGREEVRYRRPHGESALRLMQEVLALQRTQEDCPYFFREVDAQD